jgi:hypothetical protein
MPILAKLLGLFTKSTTGAVKDVTGTVRDVQEIKKARIEIELKRRELDDQKSLITKATFEDVKQFDPKYKLIRQHLGEVLEFTLIAILISTAGIVWSFPSLREASIRLWQMLTNSPR